MQMFGWKADDNLYTASNVIEIAKDRDVIKHRSDRYELLC